MNGFPSPSRWAAAVLAALVFAVLTGPGVLAAGTPTAISIGAPATAELGQPITLQARLVDSTGAPLAKATVLFVTSAAFLSASGDVVVASATTTKDGLASTTWQPRRDGTLTIRAEFRGDTRYAPSRVATKVVVSGTEQLYTPRAGLHLPGLNAGPAFGQVLGTSRFWPVLSGWPIGAILLLIWSLYGVVVILLFRIAAIVEPAHAHESPSEMEAGQ